MNRKVLIPIDGSEPALRALSHCLQDPETAADELHLLNVQLPVDGHVRSFVSTEQLHAYHQEEGQAQLQEALALAQGASRKVYLHVRVGHPADVICQFAEKSGMDEIVMGTHGRTGLLKLVMGSVAAEVSSKSRVRLTLIA